MACWTLSDTVTDLSLHLPYPFTWLISPRPRDGHLARGVLSEEVTGSKLGGSWVANVMKPCLPFPSHLLPLSWRSVSLMFSCCFPLNDLFLYGNVVMGYAGLKVGGGRCLSCVGIFI